MFPMVVLLQVAYSEEHSQEQNVTFEYFATTSFKLPLLLKPQKRKELKCYISKNVCLRLNC